VRSYLLITRNVRLIGLLVSLHPEFVLAAGESSVAALRDRGVPVGEDGVLFDAGRDEVIYLATNLDDAGVWARARAVHSSHLVFPLADDEAREWLRQRLTHVPAPRSALPGARRPGIGWEPPSPGRGWPTR
jgi:hypothetical protein